MKGPSSLQAFIILSLSLGDYAGVKHALREAEVYYNMDVNCLDPLGRSALLIAIENENLEIMELLLDHGIHTGDALLYAIRKEVVGAVELLLSHRRPSGEKQVGFGPIRDELFRVVLICSIQAQFCTLSIVDALHLLFCFNTSVCAREIMSCTFIYCNAPCCILLRRGKFKPLFNRQTVK